jgi:protein involved in polysaccharide export with SLBB domain
MARIVRSGNPTKVYDLGAYLKTGQGLEDVVLRDSVTLLIEYNDYLPITLLGTVRTTVLYKPGLKLLEAIALAGGLLDEEKQNIKNIRILRHLEDGKVQRLEVNLHDLIHRGQVNRDIEVLPGDYIVVPRRSKRRTVWNIVNTVLKPFVQVGLLGFYF